MMGWIMQEIDSGKTFPSDETLESGQHNDVFDL